MTTGRGEMQGDDAGGVSAAARARDLQPPGEPEKRDLGAPVSADDLCEMDARHHHDARRQQESIDRRIADEEMIRVLSRAGFQGSLYERFAEELARYGISVLRGWMHSGFIFKLVARRGYGLNPHELELEELVSNSDLREELATMTVACALPRFRQRAFVEGGWQIEGGASITTYFMGACAYDFPNEFRRHRAGEERQRRVLRREQHFYEPAVGKLSVAEEVIGNLRVLDIIGEVKDPRTQAAVALTVDRYSQEEIRQLLEAESVRAVEGLLYRWRQKEKKHQGAGEDRG
ncbi:hypothetical protein ACFYXH_22165 [Streptomyces sp. NPDC002730]|uniref:hypothetical protein n=1 Tax=Streptomyces sp. NPDC002730 TaxID=3364662 RepID=UPI0036B90FAD